MSPESSDHDLLRAFAHDRSQLAFSELVRRHVDLVYSAARRQVRSPQLAEEIAQSVFIDLARDAAKISAAQPLAAWLHVVTRRTAIDAIRRETRRHAREHEAAALARDEFTSAAMNDPSPDWPAVEPLLDEAVESLAAADRAAILLRYFENKSLRDVGAALGTNDDAAQKRVSRALEQLRAFFLRRGIAVTAAGLATTLTAHAIEAAPAGLGATISGAVGMSAIAATSGAAGATSRLIAMATLQKSVVVAAFLVAGGAGLYQATLVARQSAEAAALRSEIDTTMRELGTLRAAQAGVATRLKTVERQIDARLAAALPAAPADAALEAQMQQWFGQLDRLKEFLAQRPEWYIPELKLLPDDHWFSAAATDRFETEEQFRRATAGLRDAAVSLVSGRMMAALKAYVAAHDGMLPASPLDLAPLFDPPIDETILARYQMLQTGKASEVPRAQAMHLIAPKVPADVELDADFFIGLNGWGNQGAAINTDVREAQRKFSTANGGQRATNAGQLLPYLKWPVSAATLEKYLNPPPAARTP
jgi:RNA polymerase sigma factor (sigma-70 family)